MITKKDYFSHPDFKYEDIQEKLEEVIDEGIEKYGEAFIHLDTEFDAGRVSVWKEHESGIGLNIGHATINYRYANEVIRQCQRHGLSYYLSRSSSRECVPTRIIVYIDPED